MVTKAFLKKCILRVSVPLLPLSIGFLAVGITLLLLGSLSVPRFVFSVPALVSGCFLWYAGMYLKNRARFFFAATFLALAGCLLYRHRSRAVALADRMATFNAFRRLRVFRFRVSQLP